LWEHPITPNRQQKYFQILSDESIGFYGKLHFLRGVIPAFKDQAWRQFAHRIIYFIRLELLTIKFSLLFAVALLSG